MCTSFKVKSSMVKVTRPINAPQYLPNRKAYELQTSNTDGTRRPVSPASAVAAKIKGQGCKVTWSVCQLLAHMLRTKSPRITETGRKFAQPTDNNALQVLGQNFKGQGHQAD